MGKVRGPRGQGIPACAMSRRLTVVALLAQQVEQDTCGTVSDNQPRRCCSGGQMLDVISTVRFIEDGGSSCCCCEVLLTRRASCAERLREASRPAGQRLRTAARDHNDPRIGTPLSRYRAVRNRELFSGPWSIVMYSEYLMYSHTDTPSTAKLRSAQPELGGIAAWRAEGALPDVTGEGISRASGN